MIFMLKLCHGKRPHAFPVFPSCRVSGTHNAQNKTAMKQFLKNDKKTGVICILLLAGSVLAAFKCIFIGLQVDEEYAVSMPYRMLLGDKMFTQIWDPHQTSAFLTEALLWVYKTIFHTTDGVVIWLRLFATLIHGILAWRIYRMLQHFLSPEYSFYLSVLYFNLLPKGYITPEFSNMLCWSLTLLLLSLFRLSQSGKPAVALESGIWMCCMALSYPSAVILFPFVLFYVWKQKGCGKKSALLFAATCLLCGGIYFLYLFSYMSPRQLLENLNYLLIGNSGHTESGLAGRFRIYLKGAGQAVLFSAAYAVFACLALWILKKCKKTKDWYAKLSKTDKKAAVLYFMLFSGILYQFVHWIRMGQEYEYSYIYAVYFVLFGIYFFIRKYLDSALLKTADLWITGNILMLIAVLMLTDLGIFPSVRYVSSGIIMALAAFVLYSEKRAPSVYRKLAKILLLSWCFVSIFIKAWEYRDNDGTMQNITCVRGMVSVGPAKGLITQYMSSYIQESTFEEMQRYLSPGESLLLLDTGGTISYLFQDVKVASYTTISDPRYNEILLKYWELNPDKYPDVIMVQCWYGELRWDDESWIIHWIDENYGASQIIDGKYFRYYIR